MYLCCDLGGTNAVWAVFNPKNQSFVFQIQTAIADYEDFYDMLEQVLEKYRDFNIGNDRILNTTLGIAGPTRKTIVRPTNIEGWEISIETVSAILKEFGHDPYATILNDFEALGYGLLFLTERGFEKSDIQPVHGRFHIGPSRTGQDTGTRSIICGPGTGLGVASIVDGLERDSFPYILSSEGGHHSLPPESNDQYRFLGRSGGFYGKRSYEEAISGPGLRNVYNFYRRTDYNEEPNYGILPKDIVALSKTGKDQAATDAVEFFCEVLASFCGNMALTFNVDKAVFLWGGTLDDISLDLLRARFKRHFADRSNHAERVVRIPVVLLKNKDLPLLGCAHCSKFEDKLKR